VADLAQQHTEDGVDVDDDDGSGQAAT